MAIAMKNNEIRNYYVIHPLDDEPEEKLNPDTLGPMAMTRSVRLSLTALRVYLIVMVLLALYRVLTMAGAFA
jgi:hypothetical protein